MGKHNYLIIDQQIYLRLWLLLRVCKYQQYMCIGACQGLGTIMVGRYSGVAMAYL